MTKKDTHEKEKKEKKKKVGIFFFFFFGGGGCHYFISLPVTGRSPSLSWCQDPAGPKPGPIAQPGHPPDNPPHSPGDDDGQQGGGVPTASEAIREEGDASIHPPLPGCWIRGMDARMDERVVPRGKPEGSEQPPRLRV